MITKGGNIIFQRNWLFTVNGKFRNLTGFLETQFLVFNVIDIFFVLICFILLLINVFKTFLTLQCLISTKRSHVLKQTCS